MKLSIIVLNYNTKNMTLKCVRSLFQQYKEQILDKEFEIIVVDNASTDGSVQAFEKVQNIKFVKNSKNYGFSKGNNIGAKKATCKFIFFLNSDTEVEGQGILKMLNFMEENPKIGILGAKLTNPDGSVQSSSGNFYSIINLPVIFSEWLGFRKKPQKVQKVDWVSGGSMMIRKKLFEDLGGFDENLFMYMEDMELCYRIKKEGFETFFYPDVEIIHKELGSSNRSFAINQIYKGILYFFHKHKPYWQYILIKFFLIAKAISALLIGNLINNNYLKKTYSGALKLAI